MVHVERLYGAMLHPSIDQTNCDIINTLQAEKFYWNSSFTILLKENQPKLKFCVVNLGVVA